MDNIKKQRTIARRFFSIAENEVRKALEEGITDTHAYKYFEEKADQLFEIDNVYKELLFQGEDSEEVLFSCLEASEQYRRRYHEVHAKINAVTASPSQPEVESASGDTVKCGNSCKTSTNFKLPILELKKFDGQAINWIDFWGQFKRIHEDDRVDDFDKFRYLLQATEPDSKARDLVESYPPSGENYQIAFEALKERFARDDVLIETYIRSLLRLIINDKQNVPLSELYTKLSAQLNALESLGVTSDKYAAMLLPMVESAIPLDELKAWERSRNRREGPSLKDLMNFIKTEVEGQERILMAKERLEDSISSKKEPTAACLLANAKKSEEKQVNLECLFCSKSHHSIECSKLANLSLEEKRAIVKKKGACFICLKMGHGARTCRSYIKCLVCARRHLVAMCPDLGNKNKQPEKKKQRKH